MGLRAGLERRPGSANEGIGAAGFGLFVSGNLFPGANSPSDSNPPNGVGGGLTTATMMAASITEAFPVALRQGQRRVQTGRRPGQLHAVRNLYVSFQYGSALVGEPNVPGILVLNPACRA